MTLSVTSNTTDADKYSAPRMDLEQRVRNSWSDVRSSPEEWRGRGGTTATFILHRSILRLQRTSGLAIRTSEVHVRCSNDGPKKSLLLEFETCQPSAHGSSADSTARELGPNRTEDSLDGSLASSRREMYVHT